MTSLPEPAPLVRLEDGTYTYADQLPTPRRQNIAPQVVQHIHQAPPDRTAQRLALGAGMGAGTVAAGVYFGPMLVAALAAIAANLALLAFLAAVTAWAVVTVVRSVGGNDGKAAAKRIRRGR